jgi:hypothetical protein
MGYGFGLVDDGVLGRSGYYAGSVPTREAAQKMRMKNFAVMVSL